MNLTQWVALGAMILLALLFSASRVLQRGPAAHAGWTAPPCLVTTPNQRTPIPAAHFVDRGDRIIVARPGQAILLQLHHWSLLDGAGIHGPFGSSLRGAPGFIAAASDADVYQNSVYVLDAAARAVHVFELTGTFARTIRLGVPERTFWQSVALFVDSTGISVLTFEPEALPPRWRLRHWRAGARDPETRFEVPGTSLEGVVAARAGADFLFGEQHTYRILRHRPGLQPEVLFERRDPPRQGFSHAERRRYATYSSRVPSALQDAYRLPDFVPPLVAFHLTASGTLAAARAHGPDSVVIELLRSNADLCTLTPSPLPRPFALGDDGVLWLDEHAEVANLNLMRYTP